MYVDVCVMEAREEWMMTDLRPSVHSTDSMLHFIPRSRLVLECMKAKVAKDRARATRD